MGLRDSAIEEMERLPSAREALLRELLGSGRVSEAALDRARTAATDEPLEVVLTRLGLLSDRELTEATARVLAMPIAQAADYPLAPILEDRLSAKFLRDNRIVPLDDTQAGVSIAVRNPIDADGIDGVRFALGRTVLPKIGYPADIEAALDRLYGKEAALGTPPADTARSDDVDRLKDSASEAPVIRLVNQLIARAVECGASDIHIEPMENALRVRYRIDGVLQTVETPPLRLASAVVSRIKIMAKLNIAERRLGQDGRIGMAVAGRDIDFRVATTPSIHGESVTLRILDRDHLDLDFAALGFDEGLIERLRAMLARPFGIVLVTGPTGSGKTTTLYTALKELNSEEKKILTVEDPVEYKLEGINQVQVKPQIGLTFAGALRSFLRHDPDIMMIGEIRDLETAEIAVQAALTGHLILSTLHTNDAASAMTRLLDMGVEDYLLTSTLSGIAAQRLVRTLCPDCREPYTPSPEYVRRLDLDVLAGGRGIVLHRARGCEACRHTGFRGRSSIVEALPMSEALRNAVLKSADAGTINRIAVDEGMIPMRAHGLRKALAGLTTVEEVFRATGAA